MFKSGLLDSVALQHGIHREFKALERQKSLDRLSNISSRLAEVRETRARLEGHVDLLEVRAPESGVVNNLKPMPPGAVVGAMDVLA